jgi:hypothetical protein
MQGLKTFVETRKGKIMKRSGVLVPIVILSCVILGCRQTRSTNTGSTTTPVSVASPTASLDDEAVGAVKKLWEEHTTKCGDSYYGFSDNYPFEATHQYTNVSFVPTRTGPRTDADRLNGILWNGNVQIRGGPYRDRIKGGEWSEWKENQSLIEEVGATKRQSGWSVVQLLHITQMKQIKCSEVN